jgi:hypothetical protein
MEVSSQLHSPAALTLKTCIRYPQYVRLGGHKGGCTGEEKNVISLPGIELPFFRYPTPQSSQCTAHIVLALLVDSADQGTVGKECLLIAYSTQACNEPPHILWHTKLIKAFIWAVTALCPEIQYISTNLISLLLHSALGMSSHPGLVPQKVFYLPYACSKFEDIFICLRNIL